MTDSKNSPPETKSRLMDTAVNLIRQSNYDNVGVAEICKHAGVTKGSFYHYFDSKADLFYESAHHYWEQMKPDIDAIFSPENNALDQLNLLIEKIVHKETEHEFSETTPVLGCPFFVAGGQVGSDADRVRQASAELSLKAITYDISLVQSLRAQGYIEHPLPDTTLGHSLYYYVMGALLHARVTQDVSIVRNDILIGLYGLLRVKDEFWPK